MKGKKWLWIGCGGCFSLVLLVVISMIAGGIWVKKNVDRFGQDMQQVSNRFQQLDRQYPFNPSEGKPTDSQRFEQFLTVRQAFVGNTEKKFDWLVRLVDPAAKPESFTFFSIAKNIVQTLLAFPALSQSLVEALEQAQMSNREYSYLTRQMAAEIVSWRKNESTQPLFAYADQYLKLLRSLNDKVEEVRQKNPGARIDLGPFAIQEFFTKLETDSSHEGWNRELIETHIQSILTSSAAVFIDCWIIQNFSE